MTGAGPARAAAREADRLNCDLSKNITTNVHHLPNQLLACALPGRGRTGSTLPLPSTG